MTLPLKYNPIINNIIDPKEDNIRTMLFAQALTYYVTNKAEIDEWDCRDKSKRLDLEELAEYINIDRPDLINLLIEAELDEQDTDLENLSRTIRKQDNEKLKMIIDLRDTIQ